MKKVFTPGEIVDQCIEANLPSEIIRNLISSYELDRVVEAVLLDKVSSAESLRKAIGDIDIEQKDIYKLVDDCVIHGWSSVQITRMLSKRGLSYQEIKELIAYSQELRLAMKAAQKAEEKGVNENGRA